MNRSQLALLGVGALLLGLVPWLTSPRLASGQNPAADARISQIDQTLQALTGQVKDLEETIRRVTAEQHARDGIVVNVGSMDTWRWALNPVDGSVLRIDQRDGSVQQAFKGRPGRWTVVPTYASYCWLFSAGGAVLRADVRDGDTKVMLTPRPGNWDVAAGGRPEQIFAVVVNRDTGETVRLDRRNGDTRAVLPSR